MKFIVDPGGALSGTIRVPGDKSLSHRTVMLCALANGTTNLEESGTVKKTGNLSQVRTISSGANVYPATVRHWIRGIFLECSRQRIRDHMRHM